MQIVCPNCETSYDVAAASFGPQGRNVRCVRCRETWLARAEEPAIAEAFASGEAEDHDHPVQAFPDIEVAEPHISTGEALAGIPHIDSPPIANDPESDVEWAEPAIENFTATAFGRKAKSRRWRLSVPRLKLPKPRVSLPVAVAAMAGLCIALVIWRQDVVRALPQTAGFFRAVNLNVNLRPLAFRDVKVTSETLNGTTVYLIEGAITGTAKTALDIPRLRFVVSDERGHEIYAWNAQPDQSVLQPGERVAFKSRLASPPAEARNVTVRFFNRRDLMAGRA